MKTEREPMTLYSHRTGALINYHEGVLYIEAINPYLQTKWRMRRWEMWKLGWKCLVCAVWS